MRHGEDYSERTTLVKTMFLPSCFFKEESFVCGVFFFFFCLSDSRFLEQWWRGAELFVLLASVFKPLDDSWLISKISLCKVAASLRVHMALRIGQTLHLKQVCRHLAKGQGHLEPDYTKSIFSSSKPFKTLFFF